MEIKTLEVLDRVLKGKRIRANTQRNYKGALTSLAGFSEAWPASGAVINEWVVSLSDKADTTVKMWFGFGKTAGSYMKRISGRNPDGSYRFINPFEDAESPKVSKKRRRYFTAEEIMLIVGACRYRFDKELILTLIDTTCRIGELVELKGVDVGRGHINTKGKTGQRHYRLDARLCQALRELAGSDDGYVFKTEKGEMFSPGGLTARARRIIVRAGMTGDKLGPHTLRHSGASLIARKTRSALAVKAMLQHDKVDTSMEYIHDVEDDIQQDISPLELVREEVEKHNGIELKQIGLGDGMDAALVPVEESGVESTLYDDMFPEVPTAWRVRPLLRNDDLQLLRRVFVGFACHGGERQDMLKTRELLKRITRRSK